MLEVVAVRDEEDRKIPKAPIGLVQDIGASALGAVRIRLRKAPVHDGRDHSGFGPQYRQGVARGQRSAHLESAVHEHTLDPAQLSGSGAFPFLALGDREHNKTAGHAKPHSANR